LNGERRRQGQEDIVGGCGVEREGELEGRQTNKTFYQEAW
jgi:hypothetical protein